MVLYNVGIKMAEAANGGVLRNFSKVTGKHLCQSLFFNKVAGLRPATLLKKTLAQVFSYEFCEVSKNTFFTECFPLAVSETGTNLIQTSPSLRSSSSLHIG